MRSWQREGIWIWNDLICSVTDETEDDLQESIEDVEEDLSIQERINVQKFKNMEARLKMKEKELQIMTEDYNNLQNRYEGELNDLNTRIIQMESVCVFKGFNGLGTQQVKYGDGFIKEEHKGW